VRSEKNVVKIKGGRCKRGEGKLPVFGGEDKHPTGGPEREKRLVPQTRLAKKMLTGWKRETDFKKKNLLRSSTGKGVWVGGVEMNCGKEKKRTEKGRKKPLTDLTVKGGRRSQQSHEKKDCDRGFERKRGARQGRGEGGKLSPRGEGSERVSHPSRGGDERTQSPKPQPTRRRPS